MLKRGHTNRDDTSKSDETEDGCPDRVPGAVVSIYFIQCGNADGPIKIGQATNPSHRLSELQVGCPYPLTILCAVPVEDADEEETALHDQLASSRIRGEWFEATPTLLKAIESIRRAYARAVDDLFVLIRAEHRISVEKSGERQQL